MSAALKFRVPEEIDTLENSEKGVTFPILSLVSGAPIQVGDAPMTITLKGVDSQAYQKAAREIQLTGSKRRGAGLEYDTLEAAADLLAAVTVAWTGFQDEQGRPAQCTAENAKAIYVQVPEIRKQVDAKVHNPVNFIRASSKK